MKNTAYILVILLLFIFSKSTLSQIPIQTIEPDSSNKPKPFQAPHRATSFKSMLGPQLKARYQLELLSGVNELYGQVFQTNNPYTITRLSYHPLPHITGLGLSTAYVNESVHQPDRFFTVSACYYFQTKKNGLMYGIRLYRSKNQGIESKDKIQHMLSYKYGNMEKLYLSIDLLTDVVFGILNINLNYIFPDGYSSIKLGYINTKRGVYNGIGYRLNFKVYKRMVFILQGNLHNKHKNTGIQAGIGWLLK